MIARRGHLAGRPADRIVVTGGLSADGRAMPVGSIAQKAVTARHARACLFVVPTANAADAHRYARRVRVVGVDTITDARPVIAHGCGTITACSLFRRRQRGDGIAHLRVTRHPEPVRDGRPVGRLVSWREPGGG